MIDTRLIINGRLKLRLKGIFDHLRIFFDNDVVFIHLFHPMENLFQSNKLSFLDIEWFEYEISFLNLIIWISEGKDMIQMFNAQLARTDLEDII